jgi:vacuolar-type H+-ATPase subunit D/Vma8
MIVRETQETINYIYDKLGEAERDNISRLMKIADIIRG